MGHVANQTGHRAKSDVSGTWGTRGQEWSLHLPNRSFPIPCPSLPIMERGEEHRNHNLDLVWLFFYLCPDFARTDRQEGTFQIQEVCPSLVSCLVWLSWDQQNRSWVCLAPSPCQTSTGSHLKIRDTTVNTIPP